MMHEHGQGQGQGQEQEHERAAEVLNLLADQVQPGGGQPGGGGGLESPTGAGEEQPAWSTGAHGLVVTFPPPFLAPLLPSCQRLMPSFGAGLDGFWMAVSTAAAARPEEFVCELVPEYEGGSFVLADYELLRAAAKGETQGSCTHLHPPPPPETSGLGAGVFLVALVVVVLILVLVLVFVLVFVLLVLLVVLLVLVLVLVLVVLVVLVLLLVLLLLLPHTSKRVPSGGRW